MPPSLKESGVTLSIPKTKGPAPGTNLAVSLHEWAVVLAFCLSALERRPVDLADFDPPDDLTARCAAALQSA